MTLDFADGERHFRLGLGQWRKIQERCDAGPGEIAGRLAAFKAVTDAKVPLVQAAALGRLGNWRVDDVREPILQGLIGGGMGPNEAAKLVRDYVDEAPLGECVPIAYLVVMASILGTDDEDASGEPKGVTDPPRSQEEN